MLNMHFNNGTIVKVTDTDDKHLFWEIERAN